MTAAPTQTTTTAAPPVKFAKHTTTTTTTTPLVKCFLNVDDTLLSVHYNGVDITGAVSPQFALPHLGIQKTLTFTLVPGAYLVIYGANIQGQAGGQ